MTKKITLSFLEVEPLILKDFIKYEFNTLGGYGGDAWKKEHKNSFIIASTGFYSCIGRVVQIRKNFCKSGLDCVILRHGNGDLRSFLDCRYYKVKKEHHKESYALLEKFFSNIPLDDADKKKYSHGNLDKKKGFIIINKEYEKRKKEEEVKKLKEKLNKLEK